jgi:hypothetical protein
MLMVHRESELIRSIRPAIRNDRFGVQRMEMLAIYFAMADNITIFEMEGGKGEELQ